MTYLIQHTRTREYFLKGTWTLDSKWAEEFSDLAKAISTCLKHELREVELVLQFGLEMGQNYRLQLSLPDQLLQMGNGLTQPIYQTPLGFFIANPVARAQN